MVHSGVRGEVGHVKEKGTYHKKKKTVHGGGRGEVGDVKEKGTLRY